MPPEVHVFDGKVGRDQQIVSRRNAQHGAVVADPPHYRRPPAGEMADVLNQLLFAHSPDRRHAEHYTLP